MKFDLMNYCASQIFTAVDSKFNGQRWTFGATARQTPKISFQSYL